MAIRGAVIKDGVVVNTVKLPDGWTPQSTEWQPPAGCTCVVADDVHIGDRYVGRSFVRTVTVRGEAGSPIQIDIDVHAPR